MPALSPPDHEATYALMEVCGNVIGVDIACLTEASPIDRLAPLMVGHPALLGALRLRGHIIPVVDPQTLCGVQADRCAPGIAAILTHGDRVVGLAVDAISGLARLNAGAVQRLPISGAPGTAFFVGGFYHEGRMVNVIDPTAIFALPGLPTAEQFRRDEAGRGPIGDSRAYLTFRAGGATFAAPAVEVYRTLPRQTVERNALTGGTCLGSVTLNDLRVPVLDAPGTLGLGHARDRTDPEIVVIGFPGDRLMGLAVDVICQIASLSDADLRPPPALLGGGAGAIGAVAVGKDGAQTYVLRVPHLRDRKGLQSIAEMSAPVTESLAGPRPQTGTALAADSVNALVRERRRYLVFRADRSYAAPIERVVRIIEPPADITPISHPTPGVLGLFSVDGRPTTLVCLARHFHTDPAGDGQRQRVLLVGSGDQQVGFLVSSVDGIEGSIWAAANTAAARFRERMVNVGRGSARQVLPCLDIEALAGHIAAQFQGESLFA